jgi:hypothetical protein
MTDHQAEVLQSCNRHMARLLCDLEDAQCPKVYRDVVRAGLKYLRHDMLELAEKRSVPLLTIPRDAW